MSGFPGPGVAWNFAESEGVGYECALQSRADMTDLEFFEHVAATLSYLVRDVS